MSWERFEHMNGPVLHLGCGGSLFSVVEPCDKIGNWVNVDCAVDPMVFVNHPKAGHVIDGFPRVVQADVRHLPFPDNYASGAYSNHTLEHIAYVDTVATLAEWRRCIRSGSQIVINVPDLLEIARKLVETGGQMNWSAMGERTGNFEAGYSKLVGGIYGEPHISVGQTHKNGFTPYSLRRALEEAGFHNVQIKQNWAMEIFNLQAEATK